MSDTPPIITVVEVSEPGPAPVVPPQLPLQTSNTIVIKPVATEAIQVKPIDPLVPVPATPPVIPSHTIAVESPLSNSGVNPPPPAALILNQPLTILPATLSDIQISPIKDDVSAIQHLTAYRAGQVDLERYHAVCQKSDGRVAYLQPSNDQDKRTYLGIVLNPALASQPTTIVVEGIITNNEWNWTTGPLHCTADGVLTQNSSNLTFQVGFALTTDTIFVTHATTNPSSLPAASNQTFTWEPVTAMAVWVIVHNLGRYPSVTLVNSARETMIADINYVDINTVTATFAFATGGYAYLV